MENKVVVVAKDGNAKVEVLSGVPYRTLKDETRATFYTSALESFVGYCKRYLSSDFMAGSCDSSVIFYDNNKAVFCNDEYDRYSLPVAECSVSKTSQLQIVEHIFSGRSLSLTEIESNFVSLRKYIDSNCFSVLGMARNLSIQKVTEFQRQKDDRGNYVYQVTSKLGGKEIADYPKEVSITVPVIKSCGVTVKFVAEPMISFAESDGDVTISFSFRCVGIDEQITNAIRDAIESECTRLTLPMFFGSMKKTLQDNAWEFQPTGK